MSEERVPYGEDPQTPEERILITRTYDGKPVAAKNYPLKAAIETTARAIHRYEWGDSKHLPLWHELNEDIQNDYRNMAQAALNALLEYK